MSTWKDHQPYNLADRSDGSGCSCIFYRPPNAIEGSTNPDHFGVKIWKYGGDKTYSEQAFDMQESLHDDGLAPPVGELINVRCNSGHGASELFHGLTTAIATILPSRLLTPFSLMEREDAEKAIEESIHCEGFKQFLREANREEQRYRSDVWSNAWWQWMVGTDFEAVENALHDQLTDAGYRSMTWDCHSANIGIWKGSPVLIDCQPESQ